MSWTELYHSDFRFWGSAFIGLGSSSFPQQQAKAAVPKCTPGQYLACSHSLRKLPCSGCNNSLSKFWKLASLVAHALQHWQVDNMQESHIQHSIDSQQNSDHANHNCQGWRTRPSSDPILQPSSKDVRQRLFSAHTEHTLTTPAVQPAALMLFSAIALTSPSCTHMQACR